jgi:hypothetical protein
LVDAIWLTHDAPLWPAMLDWTLAMKKQSSSAPHMGALSVNEISFCASQSCGAAANALQKGCELACRSRSTGRLFFWLITWPQTLSASKRSAVAAPNRPNLRPRRSGTFPICGKEGPHQSRRASPATKAHRVCPKCPARAEQRQSGGDTLEGPRHVSVRPAWRFASGTLSTVGAVFVVSLDLTW